MLVLALAFLFVCKDASAESAGRFQFVAGDVSVIAPNGTTRNPVKGDELSAGDRVVTGANGIAQLRMNDGGFIAVRADTDMTLEQFVFNGEEDGNERSLIKLVKGGFRTITGMIGQTNKENYRIETPASTIGIRGTDHEPVVILPGDPRGFEPGTYERVYRGAVVMASMSGALLVRRDQAAFVGIDKNPVLLDKVPLFYSGNPVGRKVAAIANEMSGKPTSPKSRAEERRVAIEEELEIAKSRRNGRDGMDLTPLGDTQILWSDPVTPGGIAMPDTPLSTENNSVKRANPRQSAGANRAAGNAAKANSPTMQMPAVTTGTTPTVGATTTHRGNGVGATRNVNAAAKGNGKRP